MKNKSILINLFVIILIATSGQIATDIYTPSIPAIATHFQTTLGQAQLTMALFVGGMASTALIYGPISEAWGRRRAVIFGTMLAVIGTIICLIAINIHWLQAGRLVQGCGLGANAALWRSIFRDSFTTEEMAKYNTYTLNFFVISIIASPFVGGYLQEYFNWQSSFYFLLVWLVLVLLVLIYIYKDKYTTFNKDHLSIQKNAKSYGELIMNNQFIGCSLIALFSYGALFCWLSAGSSVLIHRLGMRPVIYGYFMAMMGLSLSISSFIDKVLSSFIKAKIKILLGICIICTMGVLILTFNYLFTLKPWMIIAPAFILIIGTTLIFINCFILGFSTTSHMAGYAGALYSFMQLLGGLLFGTIISHINSNSPIPMGILFIACGLLGLLSYFFFLKNKNLTLNS